MKITVVKGREGEIFRELPFAQFPPRRFSVTLGLLIRHTHRNGTLLGQSFFKEFFSRFVRVIGVKQILDFLPRNGLEDACLRFKVVIKHLSLSCLLSHLSFQSNRLFLGQAVIIVG